MQKSGVLYGWSQIEEGGFAQMPIRVGGYDIMEVCN